MFFSPFFLVLSSHIELQICIRAKFKLGSCIAAGCRGFFQTKRNPFWKCRSLAAGTKDSWDLFELDRVWNWCYLNKGKMFSSSSSKWIYIYSSRCCKDKFQTKFNTLSFLRNSSILWWAIRKWNIQKYTLSTFSPIYGSDFPVRGKWKYCHIFWWFSVIKQFDFF